jgi:DNA-binding transcriptional LysR family regulator
LTRNIAYSCDDTFSLVSLVSAGLGVGFAPEWTADLPNRNVELREVRGIEFKIGLGVAWNTDDPTTARDDIVDIARSLARRDGPARKVDTATAACVLCKTIGNPCTKCNSDCDTNG